MLKTMTILLAVVTALSQAVSPLISMTIRSDERTGNFVHINFYNNSFDQFYGCLSNNKSLTCAADLSRDEKQIHKNADKRITNMNKPTSIDEQESYSDYFTCAYLFENDKLSCRRLPALERICDVQNMTQYFQRVESSGNSKCVGLVWSFREESLLYENNHNKVIIRCKSKCNLTSTTARPDHPRTQWPPPLRHSNDDDDDDDHRHGDHPKRFIEDYLDKKSHIIIAVVCSMGVTAILLIAAGFFRRKLLQKRNLTKESDVEDVKNIPQKKVSRKKSEPARKFGISSQSRLSSIILNPTKLATSEI